MSVSTDPRLGSELLGYRIDALIDRGGMGVVYRAYDLRLKRNVALKLIAPELSEDERFRERFLTETELAASLDHPNVIPIYSAGEHDDQLYLAMRYVEGSDLKALLAEGPLEPARAIAICTQVAAALDAAHARGLVHRDVKPSNVLLDAQEHAYLADFGLSRRLSEQAPGLDTTLSLGTPAYVAPEQIEGDDVGARADVYSLGCLLYECLTGEAPFPRESELAVLWAHLNDPPPSPSGLEDVMAKALAKGPHERYGSCGELVEAAREALGLSSRRDRRPLLLAGVGALLAAGALAVGLALALGNNGPGAPSTTPTLTPKVDSLQRIDPKTNELTATIGVGSSESSVAVGEGAVWVTSRDEGTISRIDPSTNHVTQAATAGSDPTALAVGDGVVWTANSEDWTLVRLDPDSLELRGVDKLPIDCFPCGVAVGNGELWVTVTNSVLRYGRYAGSPLATIDDPVKIESLEQPIVVGKNAVWVIDAAGLIRIDPAAERIAARIELPFTPAAIVDAGGIAAGAGAVWITNPAAGTVSRVDPATNSIAKRARVGQMPLGVGVGAGSVWVANHDDGTVSRIDPGSGRILATIPVGPNPTHVAAGEDGVWVTVHPAR